MKTHLTLLLSILALALTTVASAQETPVAMPDDNLIPESPRAYRIREASLPTPALVTGAAEFEVPICTLEGHGLVLPFSLKYHSNGIRVDDDPFPCGYGWSLMPGCRIQRQINGRPDEHFPHYTTQTYGSDYERDFKCMCDSGASYLSLILPDRRWDPEHDIFTIMLPDKTLTMIYDNGVFRGADCGEYRVTGNKGLEDIYVTDPRGYTYHFIDEGEYYHDKLFRQEWLLHSITSPAGEEIALFTWFPSTNHNRNSFQPIPLTAYYNLPTVPNPMREFSPMGYPFGYQSTLHYFGMCELAGVSLGGRSIFFDYFKDSQGNCEMLKKIKVTADGNTETTVTFSYIASSGCMLEKIVHSADGTYTFDYDRQALGYFPAESLNFCPSQDWWGFYNGKTCDNSIDCLFPTVVLSLSSLSETKLGTYEHATVLGADRSVDTVAMQAKILKKAICPTGAVIEWEYEPHRFREMSSLRGKPDRLAVDNKLSVGGGLRVKKITVTDPAAPSLPEVRTYSYTGTAPGLAVCKSVPTLSTFIKEKVKVGFYRYVTNPLYNTGADYIEETGVVEVANQSDYLTGLPGELPIWYKEVTEYCGEGKTVSTFSYVLSENTVIGRYDWDSPSENHTSFTQGVELVRRDTYSKEGTTYTLVQTEEMEWEKTNTDTFTELRIQRYKYQNQDSLTSPDFSLGWPYRFTCTPIHNNQQFYAGQIMGDTYSVSQDDIYRSHTYNRYLDGTRLKSRKVTLHTDNGSHVTTETYTYLPGTSLVSRTDYSTSDGKTHHVDVVYVPADASGTQMTNFNITGVPTTATVTYGTSQTRSQLKMYHNGENMMLPASFTHTRGGKSIVRANYAHDSYGNLAEISRADGTVTSYIWSHEGLYPEWRVDGMTRTSLKSKYGNVVDTGDGETLSLSALRSTTVAVTRAEWLGGVGVSALTPADGIRHTFGYDTEGRPSSEAIDGHGTVSTTAYIIGVGGRTYTDHRTRLDAAGSKVIREVTNYDSRGRQSSTVIETAEGITGDLRVYDAMGRLSEQWAATPLTSVHPTATTVRSAAKSFHGDTYPYAVTAYEPSPRGMVRSVTKAGDAWHSGSHAAVSRLTTNLANASGTKDEVCPRYEVTADGVKYLGAYAAGMLRVEEMTDEDGMISQMFTDMRGLKVMERRGKRKQWLSTRYIYDDYGQLRYVLPPAVSDATMSRTHEKMRQYAYWYEYDWMGNVTLRRIPGCEPVIYRYDSAGRLVAEQDGNTSPRWLVHLYDCLGREVVTAEAAWTDAQLTAFTAAPRRMKRQETATTSGGYVCDGYTMPALKKVITSRVYDSRGRLASEDAGDIKSSYTYDTMGRIATQTDRYPTSTVVTSYTYSYTGKPLTCKKVYSGTDAPATTQTAYTYDGADRLVKTVVTRGTTGTKQTSTVTTSYDALGRVSEIRYGDAATRQMTYDVHGWTDSIVTVITPDLTGTPVVPALTATDESAPFRDGAIATRPLRQVERLMYAAGATPCYNGNISSRVFADGRYDYTYDSYNRLISADYKAPAGSKARYTCTYGYDANSNISSLSRSGIVNIAGTTPVYDTHDYLYYTYDGNQLVSLGSGSAGVNYEGRTGLGNNADGTLTYDSNGNLTSDGTRGIASVSYTLLNQPERIDFDSREALVNSYDGRGFKHMSRLLDGAGKILTLRRYIADAVIEDGAVTMQRFAGGYFDAKGTAHYYLTDYQGNVTEVVNASGAVVQSVCYYPDGEPWREPTGTNHYTFGGKERVSLGGLNQYDFGPRMLNAAVGVWGAPDRMAEKYYGISPYSYCAGNPVRYTDPTGCKIMGVTKSDMTEFIHDLEDMLPGEEFQNFRSLLVADKKGRTLAPIAADDLAAAFAGITLSEDQQALLDIVVNTINSDDKHVVEYKSVRDKISWKGSQIIRNGFKGGPIETAITNSINKEGGLLVSVVYRSLSKGGITGYNNKDSHSVIFIDDNHPNGRAVTTGHEVFGHGRSWSQGYGEDYQHVEPIRMENLILRVMKIDFVNDGSTHGNGSIVPDPSALPSFR